MGFFGGWVLKAWFIFTRVVQKWIKDGVCSIMNIDQTWQTNHAKCISGPVPHLFWRSHSAERSPPPGGRSLRQIWSGGRAQMRWSAPGRCCCSVDREHLRFLKCHRGSRWSRTWEPQKRWKRQKKEMISCWLKIISHRSSFGKQPLHSILLCIIQQEGIKRGKSIKVEQQRVDKHR